MIINQQNLRGLTIGYSTAFNKALDETKTNWQMIATKIPSTTAENNYKWLGQMPGMREWIGEREIQSLDAYDYTIKNKKFERTIGVPREDIEDDQFGIYTAFFSGMGEQAALHPEELVFGLLSKGFVNKCYDGQPYFSDNHVVGKIKFSNKGTAKLTPESYREARKAIMSIKGEKGKNLNLVPDLLVVSPSNEYQAKLILEADQIEGTTNVDKGTAQVLVTTELAGENENMWFLLCTKKFLKPFIYQERKPMKFVSLTKEDDINVFLKDLYLYGADSRCNAGYGFWQMAFGSTGKGE